MIIRAVEGGARTSVADNHLTVDKPECARDGEWRPSINRVELPGFLAGRRIDDRELAINLCNIDLVAPGRRATIRHSALVYLDSLQGRGSSPPNMERYLIEDCSVPRALASDYRHQ